MRPTQSLRVFILLFIISHLAACKGNSLKAVVQNPDEVAMGASSTSEVAISSAISASSQSAFASEAASSGVSAISSMAAFSSEAAVYSSANSHAHSSQAASSMVAYSSSSTTGSNANNGQWLFNKLCSSCHNPSDQTPFYIDPSLDQQTLAQVIHQTMPFKNSDSCVDNCADQIAEYLWQRFNP